MSRRGSLLGTFFPTLVITLIVTMVLVTGFSGRAMRQFFLSRTATDLENLVEVTGTQFSALVAADNQDQVQVLCRLISRTTATRLTVILSDGTVIGDSDQDPALMENHADRPEVVAAWAGQVGRSTRYSPTLGDRRMYIAVAYGEAPTPYVVRASLPLASLADLMADVYRRIAFVGFILLILAALTSFLLARRLSRSLQRLQRGAEAFAEGDLSGRLAGDDTSEIARVAEAMNRMAAQLTERFETIVHQRNESDAVLASMVEGVLAIDDRERVLSLNRAAGRMLGHDPDTIAKRSIQEIGRNSQLTQLAQSALAGDGPMEQDIRLGPGAERWAQVHATGLIDQEGHPIGALLVLNDVTKLRRLENMRRDFVANVSHELKTPITSIKGFVETLLDDPPEAPAELKRFLQIINKQADRLDAIITDLLALSRLEQNADGGIEAHDLPLCPVLERVVRDLTNLRPALADRLKLACPADVRARINAPLLEQAINNLLGNALKYSPSDTPVCLSCDTESEEVVISVSDQGPGIPAEHLPRLFERFYRVDKARSRQLGGTGLGLAICKHIAQAHGGSLTVASEVGVGSTFTIHLPQKEPA